MELQSMSDAALARRVDNWRLIVFVGVMRNHRGAMSKAGVERRGRIYNLLLAEQRRRAS